MEVLPISMKKLKLKRSTLADGGWFQNWGNSPVLTTTAILLWLEIDYTQVNLQSSNHLA